MITTGSDLQERYEEMTMANILIVDDEELARFTLRDILESAGHSVTEACNGNEAIEQQRRGDFDLVITDVVMPEKEGVETIIELKRDYPELKIIAISGGGRTKNLDFLKLAEDLGADDAIAKPFTEDALMACVDECLKE